MAAPTEDPSKTPEKQSPTIPGLNPKQVAGTVQAVNKGIEGLQKDPDVLDIAQAGEYTIVTYKDCGKMQVFDEKGVVQAVADLNVELDLSKLLFDPPSYIAQGKKPQNAGRDKLYVEDLPVHQRTYALKLISMARSSEVHKSSLRGQELKLKINGEVLVSENGKYLILFDKNASKDYGLCAFVAYKIKGDDGNAILPRNWVKITPAQSNTLPDEILDVLDILVKTNTADSTVKVKEKTYAQSTDLAINFIGYDDTLTKTGQNIDRISKVKDNICVAPNGTAYYCSSERASKLHFVKNTNEAVSKWIFQEIDLPKTYLRVSKLSLDPTGTFFVANTNQGMLIWSISKGKVIEIDETKNVEFSHFDNEGRIVLLDDRKRLRVYEHNLDQMKNSIELAEIEEVDLSTGTTNKKKVPREMEGLLEAQGKYTTQFKLHIDSADSTEKLGRLKAKVEELHVKLTGSGGRSKAQADFLVSGVREEIAKKETVLADAEVAEVVKKVRIKLQGGATGISTYREIQDELDEIDSLMTVVSPTLRNEIRDIAAETSSKSADIFRSEAVKIESELTATLATVKKQIDGLDSLAKYEDWRDLDYPHIIGKLGGYLRMCPAECDDTAQKIILARKEIQKLADTVEKKVMESHEQVREKAATQIETRSTIVVQDINAFIDRLVHRKFKKREEAEDFVRRNPAFATIEAEIKGIGEKNADKEKELNEKLEGALMNAYYQIELASQVVETADGREMVVFGKTLFPKYEAPVRKSGKRTAEISFLADEKTKGPGISAKQIYGDLAITIMKTDGEKEVVRLFEGLKNEDDWRYGGYSSKGKDLDSTYVQQSDYVELRKKWADWSKGSASQLRAELDRLRKAMEDLYETRPDPLTRKAGNIDPEWEKNGVKYNEYKKLLEEYANFCVNNSIHILRRLDQVINNPAEEVHENGKGIVPDWSPHWVVAPEDEKTLEKLALNFKMQLENQEGIVNLKGHAGTGKDVLMKIFANRTRRPMFSFDCSRWTTEVELSEDLQLEAENGATKSIKVPSTVLIAAQTPGAILYFNEFNAMPEEAQLFLHALFDEKRSITLKTRSGKTVKADPSVLLACSMNPNYPGTFKPQMATRSRFIDMEIDYPPLHRPVPATDTNQNSAYSSSEALKIAKSVGSLKTLTREQNMDKNAFIQMWEFYVNGVGNPVQMTTTQKFDLDTIVALVQFTNKIRDNFILKFEKARPGAGAAQPLPVEQPITLREMRRCAWKLSQIPDAEKTALNSEQLARDLIEEYYLSHFDKKADTEAVKNAMKTWTSSKRVR